MISILKSQGIAVIYYSQTLHQGKSRWHSYIVLVYVYKPWINLPFRSFRDCAMYFDHGVLIHHLQQILGCFLISKWNSHTAYHLTWDILVGGFNPSEKICSSKWESFSQVGVKIKNSWNHHPDSSTIKNEDLTCNFQFQKDPRDYSPHAARAADTTPHNLIQLNPRTCTWDI